MWPTFKALLFIWANFAQLSYGAEIENGMEIEQAEKILMDFVHEIDHYRPKRDADRGVTNLDIRDAILQLLNVIRDGNKKMAKHGEDQMEMNEKILQTINTQGGTASIDKKIDNISTFLLRMYSKMDQLDRHMRQAGRRSGTGGGQSDEALTTLAKESFDILTLLPTYIENTKSAVDDLAKASKDNFEKVEYFLVDNSDPDFQNRTFASALKATESHIKETSKELKDILVESGNMAESLFERVNDGYTEMSKDLKGLTSLEKVMIDTADSVMDTRKKLEFGVQQIVFKMNELAKSESMNDKLQSQFEHIASTILSNQTEALANLTSKVEKEIGQVWRQMGIMYGQVSNSISILEKVKSQTEGYVNNTSKNLGTMEGTVTGLTDRMVDVDSNLNYMLGQLSLVVQEFNQVKTGLSEAMNGISDEVKEYKPASNTNDTADSEGN